MTEQSKRDRTRRLPGRRPTRVGGWPLVMATSLAIFLCMFAALTWRARAGLDPVLSANSSQQAAQPQKVIKRTVVVRRVIITELPAKSSGSSGTGNVGAGSYTPPTSSYSAPAQQYTPPAYTPPPAPVTRAS